MKHFVASCLAILVAAGMARPLAAHTLVPDVQDVGARLEHCPYDLFRARQADGTYLAEIADDLLLDFYTLILGQSLRRSFPAGAPEARTVPIRRLLDDVADIGYAGQIPIRLGREPLVAAYFDLLRAEWSAEDLQQLVGARRVKLPQGTTRGDLFAAAILAIAAADLHERLAWGPKHVADRIESARDPASWSLDGVPLAAPQLAALVDDLESDLAGMSARQKIDLVGEHCLHFHPDPSGLGVIYAAGSEGSRQDPFDDSITVTGAVGPFIWLIKILFNAPWKRPKPGAGDDDDDRPEPPGKAPPPPPPPPPPPTQQPPPACTTTQLSCSGCPSPQECRRCCAAQAGEGSGKCDEVGSIQDSSTGADVITLKPNPSTFGPDADRVCKEMIRVYVTCARLCDAAGH